MRPAQFYGKVFVTRGDEHRTKKGKLAGQVGEKIIKKTKERKPKNEAPVQ